MTRTPGAKNKPPDPQKELEKVRKLFADKGLPFPGDSDPDPDPDPDPENENDGDDDNGKLKVTTGEGDNEDGFECGACGSELDSALAVCPHCGAKLTWSA